MAMLPPCVTTRPKSSTEILQITTGNLFQAQCRGPEGFAIADPNIQSQIITVMNSHDDNRARNAHHPQLPVYQHYKLLQMKTIGPLGHAGEGNGNPNTEIRKVQWNSEV